MYCLVYGDAMGVGTWGQEPKYEPKMLDSIIACAKEGKSIVSRAVAIGISKQTYFNWINTDSPTYNEEFHKAHILAEDYCQDWWETQGLVYMVENGKDSPRLNSQVYRLNMMNRFGWGENTRNENKNHNIVINDGGNEDSADN